MALRLAKLNTPQPPADRDLAGLGESFAGSPNGREHSLALALWAQGSQALRAGQLGRFRELIVEAGALEDYNCRYLARSRMISDGLALLSATETRKVPALLVNLAEATFEALEDQPREPLLLNAAGIALYELWALDGASALFEAVVRLDPLHSNVAGNLAGVARRRKKLGAGRGKGDPKSLSALTRRARSLAKRAQPASGLTLSLCMIVRDEGEMLGRCLTAAAPAVDEMVIVDTGSSDNTVEIAQFFGARVIEYPWTGSFAEARNVSFAAATGDWLIYLDADEVLSEGGAEELRSLLSRTWREAFWVCENSYTGNREAAMSISHDALRVFRNRPAYRFNGRLHEQIAHTLPADLPERVERSVVQVEHYGYLGDVVAARDKSARNLELLRAQQADGASGPFLEYNLGVEMMNVDDYAAAVEHFENAWRMLQSESLSAYAFAPPLARQRALALLCASRWHEAIAAADQGLERFPALTDLVLVQARAHAALGEQGQAIERYERCIDMGDAPRRYTGTVGSGTYLPRVFMGELLLAHGDAARAVEVLGECVRQHPGFLGAVLPYADALLATGGEPDSVTSKIESAIDPLPAPARFLLGTALYESGAAEAAGEQFEAVLARQPHSARARIALGETLLARRAYQEAAEAVCEIADADALAVPARRSELFARILAEHARTQEALERASRAGMEPEELDVFTLWIELTAGRPGAPALREGSVQPLGLLLEALLRLREFDAFAALLPALARTPLAERARRHLLAELYLRRGYLKSAAREWMTICQEEPDAQALAGLAQVAGREGMSEQAAEFARHAIALEPSREDARQLLASLAV